MVRSSTSLVVLGSPFNRQSIWMIKLKTKNLLFQFNSRFNLPFLHLKKQCLLKQLATNEREIDACCQELTLLEESDDQNYERFLYTIQNRRREIADSLSQVPKSTKSESSLTSKSVPFNLAGQSGNPKEIIKPTPSIIIGLFVWLPFGAF